MVPEYTKLEAETREEIDNKLIAAGWSIQDKERLNLNTILGIFAEDLVSDTRKKGSDPLLSHLISNRGKI